MSDKISMIMVCLKNGTPCEAEGCVVEANDKTYLFCCSKGFELALSDFNKKTQSDNIIVTDKK